MYNIPRARADGRTITEYDDEDRVIHCFIGGGANCFLRPFYVALIIITTVARPFGCLIYYTDIMYKSPRVQYMYVYKCVVCVCICILYIVIIRSKPLSVPGPRAAARRFHTIR